MSLSLRRLPLLLRVVIAMALGVAVAGVCPDWIARLSATFNALFSQFLGFVVPLIIVAFVTSAIGDIGRAAGRLLVLTVVIAYADTTVAGLLAYGTGSWLFPSMVSGIDTMQATAASVAVPQPYFSIEVKPVFDVMTALVLAFMTGLCIAMGGHKTLRDVFSELTLVMSATIRQAIVPLLPVYIFGLFLSMTISGEAFAIMAVFAKVICVIFALHVLILLYQFLLAGAIVRRNPLRMLATMMPAYFTALGTSSSAATIPVTLRQTRLNGVTEAISGFVVPLCATIHMSGSAMKITACAFAVCLMEGISCEPSTFVYFVMLLGVVMVASPGVPGGAIMAALAPLSAILGFTDDQQALMIALYIAMDSFGTACNVTGDGAIAAVIDRLARHHIAPQPAASAPAA